MLPSLFNKLVSLRSCLFVSLLNGWRKGSFTECVSLFFLLHSPLLHSLTCLLVLAPLPDSVVLRSDSDSESDPHATITMVCVVYTTVVIGGKGEHKEKEGARE